MIRRPNGTRSTRFTSSIGSVDDGEPVAAASESGPRMSSSRSPRSDALEDRMLLQATPGFRVEVLTSARARPSGAAPGDLASSWDTSLSTEIVWETSPPGRCRARRERGCRTHRQRRPRRRAPRRRRRRRRRGPAAPRPSRLLEPRPAPGSLRQSDGDSDRNSSADDRGAGPSRIEDRDGAAHTTTKPPYRATAPNSVGWRRSRRRPC